MNDIDISLIPDFVAEAVEHLEEMESGLLKIEANPNGTEILNGIFRNIHTIKGAAQFIGLKQTAALSHNAENLLDLLRSGERACTPSMVDVLIQVKDRLGHLLREIEHTESEQTLVDDLVAAILVQLEEPSASQTEAATAQDIEFAAKDLDQTSAIAAEDSSEPEDYQEELDQELFSIFLVQLTEEMTTLRTLLDQAKIADVPGPLILDCVSSIEKLKSSSNYMGYEHLINIYDAWIQDLYKCLEDDIPNLQIMEDYFTKILQRFPALDTDALSAKKPPTPTAKSVQLTAKAPAPRIADVPIVSMPQKIQKVANNVVDSKPSDTLLTELNTALQKSMVQAPISASDDMEDVFEELTEIVPDDEEPIAAAPLTVPVPALQSGNKEPTVAPLTAPSTHKAAEPEEIVQDDTITEQPKLQQPPNKLVKPVEDTKNVGGERTLKRSVRVDAEKIDTLMNQVGELIVHRSYFNQIQAELIKIQRRLDELGVDPQQAKALRALSYRYSEAIVSLSRTANELQEGVMKVRMLPIAQLFNRYPRLVHDLVRHSDKQVQLEMRGEETELDKMIIEEVSDPLIHIIRNAVDHGFETTAERAQHKKPETGTLLLEAYHESNHIVIKVTDDGRGIDTKKVGAKALEKGLVTETELEHMTPREIMRLTMAPGFSTADAITSTSGRGVGMDVVRKNIEKLNGSVEIDSELGKGTRFRLKIPLTLAIISALQVRVGDNHFTVPLANVEETLRVFEHETSVIEGIEVVQLRGHTMPIFRLASIFGIEGTTRESSRFFVVVVNTGNEKVGLVVDELLGQDEVVIKPLIDFLQEKSGFSGATIIGGGRVSLILDVYELVKMTAHRQANVQHQLAVRRRQQMHQNRMALK